MIPQEIVQLFKNKRGTFGLVARSPNGETLFEYNSLDSFPLASSAKVVLGTLVALAVSSGDLSWSIEIDNLVLDPKEDSSTLYPHLQGMQKLQLRNVVEIMIACHDRNCADAVANLLGGWTRVGSLVTKRFPGIEVHSDARNEEKNAGQLTAIIDVMQCITSGYLITPNVFEPVIAGLVRMADKIEGIPFHEQWNMTGGLPTALINTGLLGHPMSNRFLLYAIAWRGAESRNETRDPDECISEALHMVYDTLGLG